MFVEIEFSGKIKSIVSNFSKKKLDDYIFIKTIIMRVFTVNMAPTDPNYSKINNIANIIQIGCGFVYMFAILQLWRKVSTKHME